MSESSRLAAGRRLVLGGTFALATGALAVPAHAQNGGTGALGVDTANFDRSVRPQDDLFRFVNGGWLARTEIPGDASSWGAFNGLREKSATRCARSSRRPPAGTARRLERASSATCTRATWTRRVDRPITPSRSWPRSRGRARAAPGVRRCAPWRCRAGGRGVGPDQELARDIVGTSRARLPTATTTCATPSRRARPTPLRHPPLTLAGPPDAAGAAARVVAFETQLAGKQWDRARNRDRNATYNRMTVAQLAAATPAFDWKAYLAEAKLSAATDVVVRQPDYLRAVDTLLAATPVGTVREYLTFKLLDAYADELPSAFQNARFDFRGRTLSGVKEQSPRWKRAVNEVEGALGEPVGQIYVKRFFAPEAKARMDALVQNVVAAYRVGSTRSSG
jgi:hypothetical protein